jgi:hypothetical protein
MSFLLDPFLAFMLGVVFSFFTKGFQFSKQVTFAISATSISLATLYSILLYLDWVHTDFLILDSFAKILPIEQQFGPRIMFHSNESHVTKDLFPIPVVVIFYALYFLWFYLGFRTARQIIEPHEPTPSQKPQTKMYLRIAGLLVFVSAGMMLFFFTMIPLDEVAIGDSLGMNSGDSNKEAIVRSYMVGPNAIFKQFSDKLCNPDKLALEEAKPQQNIVSKDSNILLLANGIKNVSSNEITKMCQSREDVGENLIFVFVNLSTWMFLIAMFLVTMQSSQKHRFWEYGEAEQ